MSDEFLPDWIRREVEEGRLVIVADECQEIFAREAVGGGKSATMRGLVAEIMMSGRKVNFFGIEAEELDRILQRGLPSVPEERT